jgi:hypothetical protein
MLTIHSALILVSHIYIISIFYPLYILIVIHMPSHEVFMSKLLSAIFTSIVTFIRGQCMSSHLGIGSIYMAVQYLSYLCSYTDTFKMLNLAVVQTPMTKLHTVAVLWRVFGPARFVD